MQRIILGLASAALTLLAVNSHAQEQELGRLFFTPEQRGALDARRKARVPDKPTAALVVEPTMRLDGFVKRSQGRTTVWMNKEIVDDTSPDAPRLSGSGASGRVSVKAGESGGRIELKPGETLDRGNGEIRDLIGDGEIKIRRGTPKK